VTEKDATPSGPRTDNAELPFARTTEPTRTAKWFSRFKIRVQVADVSVFIYFYSPFSAQWAALRPSSSPASALRTEQPSLVSASALWASSDLT